MIDIDTAPYGALLLRLCLATMFAAHGCFKWRVHGIPVEAKFFEFYRGFRAGSRP